MKYSTTGKATGAWFGVHNIKGTPANWNGNPSAASFASPTPAGEYCFMVSTGGTQTWQSCSYTNITVVYGAICYKQGLIGSFDYDIISGIHYFI